MLVEGGYRGCAKGSEASDTRCMVGMVDGATTLAINCDIIDTSAVDTFCANEFAVNPLKLVP